MTNSIPLINWLGYIEHEYMDTFLKEGGSAVKIAVVEDQNRNLLIRKLESSSRERNFLFFQLDAVKSRVYMPQDVFFRMAEQIDWMKLANKVVHNLLSRDFHIPNSSNHENVNLIEMVAQSNHIEPQMVLYELRPKIQEEIAKNPNMAKPFRIAMTHLCLGVRDGGRSSQPLLDWLTGKNTRISNVKPFQIHTPINRTTARHFIESAVYWIRKAGYAGTVILLDNRRVTLAKNPLDGFRFYSKAMAMDHYELLREFIDDIDRLSGTLLVTLSAPEFIEMDSPKGWAIYPALRTRVMDDVRDKNLANPVASLIRLS